MLFFALLEVLVSAMGEGTFEEGENLSGVVLSFGAVNSPAVVTGKSCPQFRASLKAVQQDKGPREDVYFWVQEDSRIEAPAAGIFGVDLKESHVEGILPAFKGTYQNPSCQGISRKGGT